MYYIIHVVKRYVPGIWDEAGEFIQAEFDDLTLADLRCEQLNEGINLQKHHYCEVRETAEGLLKSKLYESNSKNDGYRN